MGHTYIDTLQLEVNNEMTPEIALSIFRYGNQNFVDNWIRRRNYRNEVRRTSNGQSPFAAILSCIDSRVPAEIIFNLGLGDIFNIRIAGNFVNDDIMGSLEFAYTEGVKLILVLGHTGCGAINAAITSCDCKSEEECSKNSEKLDNGKKCNYILPMIKKLCRAVCSNIEFKLEEDYKYKVTRKNVEISIEDIRKKSTTCIGIAEKEGKIKIIGGIYDISKGKVSFFECLPKE